MAGIIPARELVRDLIISCSCFIMEMFCLKVEFTQRGQTGGI
jgi:hypothetical protein